MEITLMTSPTRTFVCCLSSLNLEYYDEWKDTNIVQDLVRFLDNVLEYFIQLAPPELKRAVNSAKKERAIGLGTLGFHSYLQKNMIPLESGGFGGATQVNYKIYKNIREKSREASLILGKERGESSDCKGSGFRHSHLTAIAPNASSSSLVNTSPSIEPWAANAFTSQGRAGTFLIKNKYLERELENLGMNDKETWDFITLHGGSCQGLDIPDHVKEVFKTSFEINQQYIVELAAQRAPLIDQSQSLNLFVDPGSADLGYLSDLHMMAWVKGVKTLYYLRTDPPTKAVVAKSLPTQPLNKVTPVIKYETCLSCEG